MSKSEITVREMKDDDLRAVSDVVCACYGWLAEREGFSPEEVAHLIEQRGSVEAIAVQRQECHFIVAEIENRVAGVAAIYKNVITKLYVDPSFHRRIIGSELFMAAERHIAETGFDDIFLGAFRPAAKFYEAMGMELEDEKISAGGPIKGHPVLLYRKKIMAIP